MSVVFRVCLDQALNFHSWSSEIRQNDADQALTLVLRPFSHRDISQAPCTVLYLQSVTHADVGSEKLAHPALSKTLSVLPTDRERAEST